MRPYGKGFGYLQRKGDQLFAFLPRPAGTTASAAPRTYDPETLDWIARVEANGGGFTAGSKNFADDVVRGVKAESFNGKLVYLLPLLGSNLNAALVPLRDRLGVGVPGNSGFGAGAYSEPGGLQGDGVNILDSGAHVSGLNPAALGAGGFGIWVIAVPASGFNAAIGCGHNPGAGSTVYGMEAGPGVSSIEWGRGSSAYLPVGTPGVGGIYGQSGSPSDRKLFKGGSLILADTAAVAVDDLASVTIKLMGVDISNITVPVIRPYAGRVGCIYMTDGTLTDSEVGRLHNILQSKLISATGRV